MIQLSNSYNIYFFIEFFLLKGILRKSKLQLPIAVRFVTIFLKYYTAYFCNMQKKYYLYEMHYEVYFNMRNVTKNLVLMFVMSYYFGIYPLNVENRISKFVILYKKQYVFSRLKQS